MPDISLNSRIWSNRGTKPAQGDEVYVAGSQPIAEYDNWTNWAITEDLHSLQDAVGNLDDTFINETGDTMEGHLDMDTYCLVYASGWTICNGQGGIELEDGSDGDNEFFFTTDADGNAVLEVDGYTAYHEGNFDPDDYWLKHEAEDRYLNVDGSDQMEASLDVGGHKIEAVDGTIEFSSSGGAGLDFTPNADGSHHLFTHSTGGEQNNVNYTGQLDAGNGQILRLEKEGQYKHKFGTEGDYRNTGSIHSSDRIQSDVSVDVNRDGTGMRISANEGGNRPYIAPYVNGDYAYEDELSYDSGTWTIEAPLNVEGRVNVNDNTLQDVESVHFYPDADQALYYDGSGGDFAVRDSNRGDKPVSVGGGQIQFDRNTSHNGNSIHDLETVNFNSPSGTALDLTDNADGSHYLWNHADGNGTTTSAHLGVGSGYIQELQVNNNVKHQFQNDGTYENWGGADFRGEVNMHDNIISRVETLSFNKDPYQTMEIDSNEGVFSISDEAGPNPMQYNGNWLNFDGGRTKFHGGSVYLSNSPENNDSYDMVWENQPSGKDFRIHMKHNPENSQLEGHFGALFSTNGMGPLIGVNVDSGITHVDEIRSSRQNASGTPVANARLGNKSNVGEIWYDPGVGEFRGKREGGEVVQLGEPV